MQLSSFVARGPAGRMMPVLCVIGGAVGALALALPRSSQAQEHDPRVPVSVDARQPLEDRRNAKPATTRTVSLHLSGVPLVDVVHEVEAQSELHVTYSSAIVPTMRSVTVNVSDVGPLEALRAALRGTGIEAVLVAPAGPIVLRKAADEGSPTGTITGTVFDLRAAQPVPSAMVHIEGTQLTTIAGTDGHFRIAKVPPGTYLVVARQIGFKKGVEAVTVQAGAETTQNFLLEPSASLLDQVVVTSTLAPTEIRALPTPITVIAAADIETAHLVRTNDIFRGEVPGAFAWDQGTNNTYGRVVVRGASSLLGLTSIKTYIDGIEVSNAMFAVVDPNSIDHIEIIRGPHASTIYGSDASGGVMQIFTKKGDPSLARPRVDLTASAGVVESRYASGSALRQGYGVNVLGGNANASYDVGGSYHRDGAYAPGYFYSAPSLFGGARISQGTFSLDLVVRYLGQTAPLVDNPELAAAGYPAFSKPEYRIQESAQQTYGAHLTFQATPRWAHTLTAGVDRVSNDDYNTRPRLRWEGDTLLYVASSDVGKTSVAYNTSITVPLGDSSFTTVTAGIDHSRFRANSFTNYGAQTNNGTLQGDPLTPPVTLRDTYANTGVFAQALVALRGALFITAGLRGDRAPNVGRQYRTTLAPRIGAAYVRQLGTVQAKFRAVYGKGIRPPISGARDGGMSAQGTVLPNPAIGPEWQTGADAGVDLAFGAWGSFSATYYDQTARDLIDLVPLDALATPAYMYQNAGSIRNPGWELDGTFSPVKAVALRGEVTVMDSRVEALSAEYTRDLRVGDRPRATPRVTSGGGIRVIPRPSTDLELFFAHTGSWTDYDYLALYGTLYGGQPRRPSQRDYLRSYPGFTKVGLTVNHRLTDRLDVFLSVENLTGSHAVEQNDVYVLPGRTTVLGTHLRY